MAEGLNTSTLCRDQYTANLALKVNAKLDGVNCIVAPALKFKWQNDPHMVVGKLHLLVQIAKLSQGSPTARLKLKRLEGRIKARRVVDHHPPPFHPRPLIFIAPQGIAPPPPTTLPQDGSSKTAVCRSYPICRPPNKQIQDPSYQDHT